VESLGPEVEGEKDSEPLMSGAEKAGVLSLKEPEGPSVTDAGGSTDAARELLVPLSLDGGEGSKMYRRSAAFEAGTAGGAVASVGEASVSARLRFFDLASEGTPGAAGSFCNGSMTCWPTSRLQEQSKKVPDTGRRITPGVVEPQLRKVGGPMVTLQDAPTVQPQIPKRRLAAGCACLAAGGSREA
jgi:hypothetical protein